MASSTPLQPCNRCGQVHQRADGLPGCTAHKKNGSPCGMMPSMGNRVCHNHGGKTPRGLENRRDEIVRREVQALGAPMEGLSPTEALLQEVRRSAGHVAWFRERLEAITNGGNPDSPNFGLIWGVTEERDVQASQFPGTDTTEGANVHVYWRMYMEERKHLVAASSAAIRAGVAEVTVKMAQQQITGVASLWAGLLRELDLTLDQRQIADQKVPALLRLLASGIPA